ncbi:DinB family protein [Corynebacterium breve]|uniref:DinB family protein n=1 Tax=Corynebacterium breve TaxID=3049799 RepID=A0ABY8VEY4_9CORY|nr:DinB family protein [Corynebacterium breve]WIM66813.1 DinB family protein [Corynebacterium breve]
MDTKNTYLNLIDRVEAQVDKLPRLSEKQLNFKAAGHPNTIAWNLWHAGRVLDAMIAPVAGTEQAWDTQGYREKFGLGDAAEGTGFGHTSADAAQIVVNNKEVLVDYIKVGLENLRAFVNTIGEQQWDEIIGEFHGKPERRQDRISLVIVDSLQHIGQAAFLAGAPHNK